MNEQAAKPTTTTPPGEWTSVDPLGEALHFLRMDGVFYTRSEFTEPWGLDLPAMPDCLPDVPRCDIRTLLA